jgi:RNA polymerase sigma factor (sigma-70 family)
MNYGKGYEFYGKLNVKSLSSTVYNIWLSRNDELPEIPTSPLPGPLIAEDFYVQIEQRDLVMKILKHTEFKGREEKVILLRLADYTLDEIGQAFGVTREQIRRIESRAFVRLRAAAAKLEREWD